MSKIIKCPKCGAEMVRRTGPYGQFYGCSKYPGCRGTRQISKGGKPVGPAGVKKTQSAGGRPKTAVAGFNQGTRPPPTKSEHAAPKRGSYDESPPRTMRQRAHDAFDPIWKGVGDHGKQPPLLSRSSAYRWLAHKLAVPVDHCHIAEFDDNMCRRVINVSLLYRLDRRFPKAKIRGLSRSTQHREELAEQSQEL